MRDSYREFLKELNSGELDSRYRSRIPVELFHESPYLDHKLEHYINNNPGASPQNVFEYLLSVESDVRSLLKAVDSSVRKDDVLRDGVQFTTRMFGREREFQLLDVYLNRRYKNNIILIGNPGVGKTALVSYYFQSNDLPLICASTADLLGGTKYRGEFESRISGLLQEARERNATIFFDEIHTLIQAGASEGGMSAANVMKPVITQQDVRIIGATTPAEVAELCEDGAFRRRFSFLRLEDPDREALRDIAMSYARECGCHELLQEGDYTSILAYLDESFPERYYPDKLIDFIDFFAAN